MKLLTGSLILFTLITLTAYFTVKEENKQLITYFERVASVAEECQGQLLDLMQSHRDIVKGQRK